MAIDTLSGSKPTLATIMKQKIFDEKIETLIKEAIDAHKRYEKIFKSGYNTYLEYETGTRERRIELLSLMHQGDDDLEMYFDKIADLGKHLNAHDFDIALRKINKEIISDQELWENYFEWKSDRSTMVV